MEYTKSYARIYNNDDSFSTQVRQLEELTNFIQSGRGSKLCDKSVREQYERMANSVFEIVVVATMSAGKSTLINALLGTDLIPSKNMACTAKLSRIRHMDEKSDFSVKAYDRMHLLLAEHKIATQEILEELNEDRNVHLTYLEGSFANISLPYVDFVLIDTPGPNNSQDLSHREVTMQMIQNKYSKPLVIYVLNATQLGITDDQELLKIVHETMLTEEDSRFIFVLNKIDELDPERESITDYIEMAKCYLENNGIYNPKIYPTSAYIAKNIRKYLNDEPLTRREYRSLQDDVSYLLETQAFHLLDYTPLSQEQKDSLRLDLDIFKDLESEEGDFLQALYHTGIPYLESAIKEYLMDYIETAEFISQMKQLKNILNSWD